MPKDWKTKLIHSDARVPEGFRSLAPPVYRGSTVLFPNAASVNDNCDQYAVGYTYGLYGPPTALELAARMYNLGIGCRSCSTHSLQRPIRLMNCASLQP